MGFPPGQPERDSWLAVARLRDRAHRDDDQLGLRCVGAGNSAAEIALELAHVCPQVDLSVRTPPNIVRRDTVGIPSQLIGIALKRAPERLMNPMSAVLRRFTVPDLADFGLPAPPGDGFTQFLRTRTVPILDHGFVSAVRSRRIRACTRPAFRRHRRHAVRLAARHRPAGARRRPGAVSAARPR